MEVPEDGQLCEELEDWVWIRVSPVVGGITAKGGICRVFGTLGTDHLRCNTIDESSAVRTVGLSQELRGVRVFLASPKGLGTQHTHICEAGVCGGQREGTAYTLVVHARHTHARHTQNRH